RRRAAAGRHGRSSAPAAPAARVDTPRHSRHRTHGTTPAWDGGRTSLAARLFRTEQGVRPTDRIGIAGAQVEQCARSVTAVSIRTIGAPQAHCGAVAVAPKRSPLALTESAPHAVRNLHPERELEALLAHGATRAHRLRLAYRLATRREEVDL